MYGHEDCYVGRALERLTVTTMMLCRDSAPVVELVRKGPLRRAFSFVCTVEGMTETQRTPEGMSSKPRIKPADAEDGRPVSISARLGRLQFHYSGKFRVLQIADIQDGPKVSKDTITLIEASLDATRPDLVIFSGNQIAGYDPAFADSFRKRRLV